MYFCVLSSCALLERLQWSRGDGQLQGWNQVGFPIVVKLWWWKWGMVKITIMQVLIVMVMNGEDNNDAGGRLTSWSSATLPRTPSWPRWPFHRGHRGLDEEDYHQVGDVDADHGFWGRPEDMNMARSAPTSSLPHHVNMVAKITILTPDHTDQACTVHRPRQSWLRSGKVGLHLKLCSARFDIRETISK